MEIFPIIPEETGLIYHVRAKIWALSKGIN
jgi:hypothetical protein